MLKLLSNRKGAALVEYGLVVAGVALISAAAVSVFGHKTNDLVASAAVILPCAHEDDNAPIFSGKLIETAQVGPNNSIAVDTAAAVAGGPRLGNNLLGDGNGANLENLVVENPEAP